MEFAFADVARLPIASDNCAIAIHKIDAGTHIRLNNGDILTLSHTVLVGHRFAVRDIAIGESLLSWGQTFGIATKPIKAGDYVANADVLQELGRRSLDFALPDGANFRNDLETYDFDERNFSPASPLPRYDDLKTFLGYDRAGNRGIGTRNHIVLLGVTSLVSGFVRKLERRLQGLADEYPNSRYAQSVSK